KEVGEKERLENPLMSYLRNKLGHIDSDALTANQSFLRVLDMVREKILPALEVNTKIASAKKRQKDLRKNLVELKELIREQGGLSYNRRVLKKLNADGTAVVVEEPAILKDFYFTFNTPKRVDQDNNVVEESGVSGVIKASMVQSRVGQQENAGLARLSQGDIDLYEKLIAEKKAFSIEMRDQDGKIIGGGWGPIGESQYEGESVAYPVLFVNFRNGEGNKATQERVGILFAQAMKIMSIDLFDRAGFKMQDSVMVSNYTATVGGVYIPMSSFLRMLVQMRSGQQLGYDDVQWPANNGSINLDYIIELLEK
ncbi:MAG: hypothetical protein KDD50_06060, partial [Bdellovibrionales bacterium]|nr:hypothetical protein [Bdellovibrionales bacterium]